MTFKTQRRFPLSARNVSAGSILDINWTNPTFATSADASAATVSINTLNSPRRSNYILFERFGFSADSVPSLGTIISYNVITSAFSTGALPTLSTFLDDDSTPNNADATNTLTSADATITNNITPLSAVEFGGELSALTVAHQVEQDLAGPNVSGTTNLGSTSLEIEYVYGFVSANGQGASSGGGINSWTSPQQTTASDNTYATQTVDVTAANQDYLNVTNFGFAIPTSATIIGIIAQLEWQNTAAVSFETVQLLKGGIRSGSNFSFGTGANPTDVSGHRGNQRTLWGNTLTPSDVNASNFGVSIRLAANSTSHLFKMDKVSLRIYYDTAADIGVNTNEYGFEISTPSLTKVIQPNSAEFGFEAASVNISKHTPENKYGFEVDSVSVSKNIVVQSSEYGYEQGSPDSVAQLHVVNPISSEYGVDIKSVSLFDAGFKIGYEISNASLVQQHAISPASSEYGYEAQSVLIYDSTRSPASSEYGFEISSPSLSQNSNLNVVATTELGFEISSPLLRVFAPSGTGTGIEDRTVIIPKENRRIAINIEKRVVIIPLTY